MSARVGRCNSACSWAVVFIQGARGALRATRGSRTGVNVGRCADAAGQGRLGCTKCTAQTGCDGECSQPVSLSWGE